MSRESGVRPRTRSPCGAVKVSSIAAAFSFDKSKNRVMVSLSGLATLKSEAETSYSEFLRKAESRKKNERERESIESGLRQEVEKIAADGAIKDDKIRELERELKRAKTGNKRKSAEGLKEPKPKGGRRSTGGISTGDEEEVVMETP